MSAPNDLDDPTLERIRTKPNIKYPERNLITITLPLVFDAASATVCHNIPRIGY